MLKEPSEYFKLNGQLLGALRMLWRNEQLQSIMMTCIILHNMIVEDEYEDLDAESDDDDDDNCPMHI
ncbi:hypothetical protein CerSpe_239460 [Prunus speciosa]